MDTITHGCASAVASAAQGSFWLGLFAGIVVAVIAGYLRDRWS